MAETVVRSLIRLVVTVAILGAVYLFIVKPILDTTNNTIDKAFDGSRGLIEQIDGQLDSAGIEDADFTVPSAQKAQRMLRCMQRAGNDAGRVQRCANRYGS